MWVHSVPASRRIEQGYNGVPYPSRNQEAHAITLWYKRDSRSIPEKNEMTFEDIGNAKIMYDEFLIFGRTEEEHNLALARVMQRAQDCGLTFCAEKCKFHQQKVSYFGLIFSLNEVSAGPNKVSAKHNASWPRSGKEAMSFISMAKTLAADFIPDFA